MVDWLGREFPSGEQHETVYQLLSLTRCCVFQAAQGPGLAFIMYTEAIVNMPLPQLWSVLYFAMLLLLGVGSMLGNITAIITPLRDFRVVSRMSNEVLNGTAESATAFPWQ